MRFKFVNTLQEGLHTVKITSVRVINEDTDQERILINAENSNGICPVVSYSEAGYTMLSQTLASYGLNDLDQLPGTEVTVKIEYKNDFLNANLVAKKKATQVSTEESAF